MHNVDSWKSFEQIVFREIDQVFDSERSGMYFAMPSATPIVPLFSLFYIPSSPSLLAAISYSLFISLDIRQLTKKIPLTPRNVLQSLSLSISNLINYLSCLASNTLVNNFNYQASDTLSLDYFKTYIKFRLRNNFLSFAVSSSLFSLNIYPFSYFYLKLLFIQFIIQIKS